MLREAMGTGPDTSASIEEISRSAIDRIRQAERALLAHVSAVETAATRHSELLTAQAELDAELIRLRARRTAHAIVTNAAGRAAHPTTQEQERELDELARSMSRFATVLDDVSVPTGTCG